MNKNILYVFFGALIEYSLNPLFVYMKEQGYNCVEITLKTCSDMKKEILALNAKENIFITSAHVFIDETCKIYQNTSFNLSALEAMDILRPVKSIYYPHDISTLVHENDTPWLNSIFDIILFPMDGYAHLACNGKPVYNVGWIKKNNKLDEGTRFTVGHGVSDLLHYKTITGFDHMYNIFKEIWGQGVIVKGTNKGHHKIWEKYIIKYLDSSNSIFDLINTCEIMLTNALTSVTLEAALSGRFTVNMLDGIFDRAEHEKYFKGVPSLKLMTIEETADLLKAYYKGDFIPEQGEDILKPFDFKRAVELITS